MQPRKQNDCTREHDQRMKHRRADTHETHMGHTSTLGSWASIFSVLHTQLDHKLRPTHSSTVHFFWHVYIICLFLFCCGEDPLSLSCRGWVLSTSWRQCAASHLSLPSFGSASKILNIKSWLLGASSLFELS